MHMLDEVFRNSIKFRSDFFCFLSEFVTHFLAFIWIIKSYIINNHTFIIPGWGEFPGNLDDPSVLNARIKRVVDESRGVLTLKADSKVNCRACSAHIDVHTFSEIKTHIDSEQHREMADIICEIEESGVVKGEAALIVAADRKKKQNHIWLYRKGNPKRNCNFNESANT